MVLCSKSGGFAGTGCFTNRSLDWHKENRENY